MSPKDFIEPTVEGRQKKLKKRAKLTDTEALTIAYKVLIDKEYQTDVAKTYRISVPRVSAIVKKASNNPRIFHELSQKSAEAVNDRAIIKI